MIVINRQSIGVGVVGIVWHISNRLVAQRITRIAWFLRHRARAYQTTRIFARLARYRFRSRISTRVVVIYVVVVS